MPVSYSVLLTVAIGRDIVLNTVEMPLNMGILCDSYTVSSLIIGFDVVMTFGN